ncbi:hypothetical protein KM043_016536 [Ampulex compressa]|nr:hypothetical protein KM043_016536 [Ampulex compressa]
MLGANGAVSSPFLIDAGGDEVGALGRQKEDCRGEVGQKYRVRNANERESMAKEGAPLSLILPREVHYFDSQTKHEKCLKQDTVISRGNRIAVLMNNAS